MNNEERLRKAIELLESAELRKEKPEVPFIADAREARSGESAS